ncbi:hypothetical protein GCM10011579_078510 [Streptomyces albiflavescens]|uniref:Secreted protein n=1 Tax=Streptomyces albiflavescens TaxID=1623582 RepID=A0A917YBY3_9ACTN|nr:hypothetical protein [Streptomyces albiflavescens]GGN86568.1 hypothetical protein GCM10011579_078510 [Streptomyces albiflavescens]
MRAKRIMVVMASPLAAAALAFSPTLMAQAAADTSQAPTAFAPQAPEVKSPSKQGAIDGAATGNQDGVHCNWGLHDNPEAKKSVYKKAKDYTAYENAYETAYKTAYEQQDDKCDPNE